MPAAQSPYTRARDLDRSAVCAVLDTAYADGQLDKAEHDARTTAAMAAKTLGELRALADDLQVEDALPPLRTPRPAGAPSRRRVITTGLVATLLLLGIGFGIGYASRSSSASPSATAGAGDDVDPVVVAQQDLHSRAGLTGLVAALRDRFGSAEVAEAVIYPGYANITVPVPGSPARVQTISYRNGFEEESNAGTRSPDDPLVDLGEVDVDAVLGLVAGAGESLAVPDPTSRYLIIGQDDGREYVSVYASNEFNESGFLQAELDGDVTSVHPHEVR